MKEQDKQAKMKRAGVSLVIGDILIATCSREADGFGSPYGLDERIVKADEIARRWNSHNDLLKACEELADIFPEHSMGELDAADFKDRSHRIWTASQTAKNLLAKAEKGA